MRHPFIQSLQFSVQNWFNYIYIFIRVINYSIIYEYTEQQRAQQRALWHAMGQHLSSDRVSFTIVTILLSDR